MVARIDPSEIHLVVTDRDIQLILQAVGKKYVPPNLDRHLLAVDLSRAIMGFGVRRLFQQPPTEQAVQERLKRLAKAADALGNALPTGGDRLDWELLNILDNEEGGSHGSVEMFCAHLDWLKMRVAAVRARDKAVVTPQSRELWGAHYWFLGKELPQIFARHFDRKPGRSRPPPARRATGPYVRFARAAAHLLGVRKSTGQPYGPETVVKALQKYRKPGKQEPDEV